MAGWNRKTADGDREPGGSLPRWRERESGGANFTHPEKAAVAFMIRQTFKTDFTSVHNLWRKNHYAWLPTSEIPKELGEELDKKHLEKLEINMSLVDAYEYMQKYVVGLEQVVLDQKDYQPKYIIRNSQKPNGNFERFSVRSKLL